MDGISTILSRGFADGSMMLMLLVFLATGTLAFAGMAFVRVRGSVKRRTARIMDERERQSSVERSLRYSGLKAVTQLIEYTSKHYANGNDANMRVLRKRMLQAGLYDPRAGAFFFIARTGLAVGLAMAVFVIVPLFYPMSGSGHWLLVLVGGIAGYIGPSFYLDKRIGARKEEHRAGFPDFMD